MTPIPEKAMPVVEVLRLDVKKPTELPAVSIGDGLRWPTNRQGYDCECPMGMHPESCSPLPCESNEFAGGVCSLSAVSSFFIWWDSLEEEDAQEAVDAIWPSDKE